MMELGGAAGDVFEVELGLSVDSQLSGQKTGNFRATA